MEASIDLGLEVEPDRVVQGVQVRRGSGPLRGGDEVGERGRAPGLHCFSLVGGGGVLLEHPGGVSEVGTGPGE